MKNSSFPSESMKFAIGAMALCWWAVPCMHWWRDGSEFAPLVWLSPAWLLWLVDRTNQRNERYLRDIQGMAQDVAHGKFDRRITNIPTTGAVQHALCWDMNDMLDQLEACFREQATALQYASTGQYFRLAQPVGLRGTFADSSRASEPMCRCKPLSKKPCKRKRRRQKSW